MIPSQPTSNNPSSPGSLCLRTPPRPWPAEELAAPSSLVPLEPTPPFLSREGVLGPPYQGPKGVCQGPSTPGALPPGLGPQPLSTFSLSCVTHLDSFPGPNPAFSHPRHCPQGSQDPASLRLQLPVSPISWGDGADGCPGWGAGYHTVCPPVWVPTTHQAPGLGQGVSPFQLLVPQGTSERGQWEPTVAWRLTGCWAQPWGRDASSSLSSSKQEEVSCCGKWYCTAGSVP